MKILVTGGAGFIGSHLCERLIGRGDYVICLDNFFTGSHDNIQHLKGSPAFEVIRADVRQSLDFLEVDQIYNLACPASPVHYQHDPVRTTETSVLGALNVLRLAHRLQCPVLQASTSEVYGNPQVHPQAERYWGNVNPIGPRACYDEGKRCAETLFFDFHRQYGVTIKVARIFNTYGPRMAEDDGRVVSNFIVQALTNTDITIYGAGDQTRSFCYIDDMVSGLVLLMNSRLDITGPINLGNPEEEISIKTLAEKVILMTGGKSKITHRPLPGDDPTQRKPSIWAATRDLKWQPKISLDAGLRRTIEYFYQQVIG